MTNLSPTTSHAPGIRQRFLLPWGVVRWMRNDPLRFFSEAARTYGDVVRLDIGPRVVHLIFGPEQVQRVLVDNATNYLRGPQQRLIRVVTGDGLLVTEGEQWRAQRRQAQPAFGKSRLPEFVETVIDETTQVLDALDDAARKHSVVNVSQQMMSLTLRVITRVTLGIHLSADEVAIVGDAVTAGMKYVQSRRASIWSPPAWLPTPALLRLRRARSKSDALIYRSICQRREQVAERDDLAALLMRSVDNEHDPTNADSELRNAIATFVGAGHETTAGLLSFALYLLADRPDVEQRIRAEVRDCLAGRPPCSGDLANFHYTRMVINETMRLYPPVWALGKNVVHDDVLGGFAIPADSLAVMSQFVTHRHPRYWPDPERFDPERFTPARIAERPRFAFFPFGGGSHQCVGEDFALAEATMVLAMIIQRFQLSTAPGYQMQLDPVFTLRPVNHLLMTVRTAPQRTTAVPQSMGVLQ